ncbi:MAPK protein hog1 [Globomyces sp. JEL0801]|nr:MAPK protein hog1 [Globomyces sp. JEL0801]
MSPAQTFMGTNFECPSRYTDIKPIGLGAFGLVCSAVDSITGQQRAIKKIAQPFSNPTLGKRAFRELMLLLHLQHDNKPANILINENCDLKICDFGLARVSHTVMTGYVATRYYRAPEIMLTWQHYNKAVDIWSLGCIFGEMLEGKRMPLFPGNDRN